METYIGADLLRLSASSEFLFVFSDLWTLEDMGIEMIITLCRRANYDTTVV